MKKLLKTIGILIVLALACSLLAILTLPLWIGPVVRPTVNTLAPKFTKTDFQLKKLWLNPYTGRLEVGGFLLGNPGGYDEPVALSLSNLVVDVAMTTVFDDCIHVEEVTVEGLFASYLSGGEYNVANFTQIQYNIAGGKEKYEEKQAKAEAAKKAGKAEEPDTEETSAFDKKLVIDRLTIRDVRVKLGIVTIPVPIDIVLKDIGKSSGGATIDEVFADVWKAILSAVGSLGDGIKAFGGMVGDGAGKLTEAVKSVDLSAAGEASNKAVDAVKGGASAVTDGAGAAVKATTETLNKATEKATEMFKGLLK